MVGNEVFFGWQLPTATVCANIGAAAIMSPDARIHLAKRIATPPEYNILSTRLRCRARQSERLQKGRESVWQHSWRSVKAIKIKCANLCAGRVDSVCGSREHDSGVEERACDSGRDGNQIALAVEHLYLWSARHLRQIHGAATADEGGTFFIGGDVRQLRHQLSGMDKQRLSTSLLHRGVERSQRVGIFDCELGDGG